MEEVGSGIQFQHLPGALKRGGGPSVRPETHPIPSDLLGGRFQQWVGSLASPRNSHRGRKGLALDQRLQLFLLGIKGCHDLTPFLYHVRYFSHLFGCFPKKEGKILQEGLYHDCYYYHFSYFEDLTLDLDLFSYH